MSCDVVKWQKGRGMSRAQRFTYVIAHSPTLPLLQLSHSSFYNPSFVSPTSQALHLRHSAGSEILTSILRLGVCPLCSVLCCPWRWPWHCADHTFRKAHSLCICLVFWSEICAPPTGIWYMGLWAECPTLEVNDSWRNRKLTIILG